MVPLDEASDDQVVASGVGEVVHPKKPELEVPDFLKLHRKLLLGTLATKIIGSLRGVAITEHHKLVFEQFMVEHLGTLEPDCLLRSYVELNDRGLVQDLGNLAADLFDFLWVCTKYPDLVFVRGVQVYTVEGCLGEQVVYLLLEQ
jgi:hypothetical protein